MTIKTKKTKTKPLTISAFYKDHLTAEYKNFLWSWGAENDQHVFININTNDITHDLTNPTVAITYPGVKSRGANERKRHIDSINSGKPGYLVLITGKKPKNANFKTEYFNSNIVISIKEIIFDAITNSYRAVLGDYQHVSAFTKN